MFSRFDQIHEGDGRTDVWTQTVTLCHSIVCATQCRAAEAVDGKTTLFVQFQPKNITGFSAYPTSSNDVLMGSAPL